MIPAQGYLVSCSTCNDIDNLFNQQPALGLLSIPKVTLPQISTRLRYITLRCKLRLPVASRFQETVHIYLISKANLLVTSETIGSPIYSVILGSAGYDRPIDVDTYTVQPKFAKPGVANYCLRNATPSLTDYDTAVTSFASRWVSGFI